MQRVLTPSISEATPLFRCPTFLEIPVTHLFLELLPEIFYAVFPGPKQNLAATYYPFSKTLCAPKRCVCPKMSPISNS